MVSGAGRTSPSIHAQKTARPAATSSPAYPSACAIPRSASVPAEASPPTSGATTFSLGAPIENVSDPLIGWPSADTTRHATT